MLQYTINKRNQTPVFLEQVLQYFQCTHVAHGVTNAIIQYTYNKLSGSLIFFNKLLEVKKNHGGANILLFKYFELAY